jgi:RNA polymerase sigma factor (sigma-70 family)
MQIDKTGDTENKLVEGLKSGDSESLKIIYNSYYPVIKSLVLRNNGSEYEAKDVFQESVILLFEKLQSPDFKLTCSIKTFIYAVSRRLWLKRWNEHKIKVYDTQFEAEPVFMNDLLQFYEDQDAAIVKMHTAIEKLGEPCASILRDFYLDEMSMNDIALKFGYTNAENAKNQKYKCLQRLKKLFFDDEYENERQ